MSTKILDFWFSIKFEINGRKGTHVTYSMNYKIFNDMKIKNTNIANNILSWFYLKLYDNYKLLMTTNNGESHSSYDEELLKANTSYGNKRGLLFHCLIRYFITGQALACHLLFEYCERYFWKHKPEEKVLYIFGK